MKLLRVAAAIVNQTPLDWDQNQANILAALAEARARGVTVLCLPELCICGYGCEDAFHAPGLRRMARRVLAEILPATRGMVVAGGLPVLHHNGLFNAAAVLVDGALVGLVAKRHLAGEGLHYEPRWFKAWPDGIRADTMLDGQSYPLGDLYFDVGGVKIGLEICEDAWVAKGPGGSLAQRGADLILNPSASHFAFGKLEVRRRFVIEGSRAFGCTYIYSNFIGNEAGRAIYDGGVLIASSGALVAQGPRFTYAPWAVTDAVIDVDATRMSQARTSSFTPTVTHDELCIRVPFAWPTQSPVQPISTVAAWEASPHLQEEEFTRAIALALFDYLRKSRSRGFVVSLSGGADSAAVACLVSFMVELACAELGMDEFRRRLSCIPALASPASDPRALVAQLLTCVYQSTQHSSSVTRTAARDIANALGARFHELDIEPLVNAYVRMVEQSLERALDWVTDDIALQNIQARTRAPGAWLIANLQEALLLSTSNRSEAAVGYATMDGDTAGGLSPLAGIDKAFIRQYLRWLQIEGPSGLHPLPALAAVNVQQPTAELRPATQCQTDEADLMPYDLLDAVENAAIGAKQMPAEVFHVMRAQFPQYEPCQLAAWVERFFQLWCRNQWKRERYAPAFHVDDRNLDPRSWCRFPILSGGFQRELAELRTLVS